MVGKMRIRKRSVGMPKMGKAKTKARYRCSICKQDHVVGSKIYTKHKAYGGWFRYPAQ